MSKEALQYKDTGETCFGGLSIWQDYGRRMRESRLSEARLTRNLISIASQLCDLQVLLNCSEAQISQLQNGEDLANILHCAWNVECGDGDHRLCSQTAWFESQLRSLGSLLSLSVFRFPNLCDGENHSTYLLGLL